MIGPQGRSCFSPRFLPHKYASEILDSHSDLTLPTVAPGQIRGRSVSSALPCISFRNRAEGTAGTFQRGKFPGLHLNPETRFSKAQLQVATHTNAQKTHSAQQAWMNSRNPLTITSVRKHRQPVILHPTKRAGRTSFNREPSVPLRARKFSLCSDVDCGLTPAKRRDLLNPFSASTLQVFQLIEPLTSSSCALRGAETRRVHG
jgi:hypothetical protein